MNNNDERFVGIKADQGNAIVYFPIGYKLPETEQELRKDIIHLIYILTTFTKSREGVLSSRDYVKSQSVSYPIHAYLNVVNSYLQSKAYYMESERKYIVSDHGKTNWSRTIKRQKPMIQQNGTPFYLQRDVINFTPNGNNYLTRIHEWCVYEGFARIGWLFTNIMPEKPHIIFQKAKFTEAIKNKLGKTYNDNEKTLFQSMLSIVNYTDEISERNQMHFGTDRFEYVWERIIDRIFGVEDKELYFPKTKWNLLYGSTKMNSYLQPDTVMISDNKIVIIDAKYYKYGITGNPNDLPGSSSINKQIAYGEYVSISEIVKKKHGDGYQVFNIFIMPFNSSVNPFNTNSTFLHIGEAIAEWKSNNFSFEHIVGVLVDMRYAMWQCTTKKNSQIYELMSEVEHSTKYL